MDNFPKKIAQSLHATKRAKERYGIHFNKEKRAEALDYIHRHPHCFIKRQTKRITLHKVVIDDITCVVVYDKKRKRIVTFLPDN